MGVSYDSSRTETSPLLPHPLLDYHSTIWPVKTFIRQTNASIRLHILPPRETHRSSSKRTVGINNCVIYIFWKISKRSQHAKHLSHTCWPMAIHTLTWRRRHIHIRYYRRTSRRRRYHSAGRCRSQHTSQKYDMKGMGHQSTFLGWMIKFNEDRHIHASQPTLLANSIAVANIAKKIKAQNPSTWKHIHWWRKQDRIVRRLQNEQGNNNYRYVRSLSDCTALYISIAASCPESYSANSCLRHMELPIHVLKHLQGT